MAALSTVPGDSRVVYFGNLSFDANEADVADFAGRAGRVEHTNYRRRYAHVTYSSVAEADAAVAQLNNVELKGRAVRAEKSRPLEERPPREARPPRLDPATGEVKTYDRRIVVRGLPRETTSEELQAVFAPLGKVIKARLGGGLGRVSFETDEAAAAALGKTGTTVSGAVITVEKERMRPRRKRGPRGEDGDAPAAPAGGAGAGGDRPARKPRAPRAEGAAPRAPAAPRTGAAPAAPRVAAPPRRVRVSGLAGMTPDMLRSLFTSIGPIVAAKVIAGKEVGFVTFEKSEDAAKAITLSGTTISGITINIEMDVRAPRAARPAGEASGAAGGAGAPRAPREPREPRPAREVRPPRETRPPREPRDLTNTLWVSGFPAEQMTVENLTEQFGRFGTVVSVALLGGGRSAYIKFDSEAAVDPAINGWNGKTPAGSDAVIKAERASGAAPRRPREGGEGAPAGGAGGEGAARRRPRRRGPRRDGGAPAATA